MVSKSLQYKAHTAELFGGTDLEVERWIRREVRLGHSNVSAWDIE